MAKVEDGVINMHPGEFVTVFSTPLWAGGLVGEKPGSLHFTKRQYVPVDGELWGAYNEFGFGSFEDISRQVADLNAGKGVAEGAEGARFATGPGYYFNTAFRGVRIPQDKNLQCRIWINRLPKFDPTHVEGRSMRGSK